MSEVDKPADNFDPHRFSAEPRRRPNRTVVSIVILFIVLMTLIGASVVITKGYVSDYMAERAEQRKEEKEIKKVEEEVGRKGKVFAEAPVGLPAGFGETGDAAAGDTLAGAIPVLRGRGGASAGAGPVEAPPPPPPPRPSLMAPSTPAATAAGDEAAPPATVEQLAAAQASTAPLSATAQASAAKLGDRSMLLARGAFIPCVLETQLVSNLGGQASCILPQHVYSDDGKVVLMEKGSSIVGTYQNSVRSGDTRIAILWQRIKTANGVVIDVDSPAADQVGVAGAPGVLDNHWPERIGAAFLLSLVEDAVAIEIAKSSRGNNNGNVGNNTVNSTANLSEKVLESTINIPPTLYKNRGDRLMVFVNRDLWFNRVYALRQQ